jgi:hypothetical protein
LTARLAGFATFAKTKAECVLFQMRICKKFTMFWAVKAPIVWWGALPIGTAALSSGEMRIVYALGNRRKA